MAIIAVAGRKGGIGKSTIAGNLAAEFVRRGRSVIALDADPQHSLATWAEQGEGILSRCVERVTDTGKLLSLIHIFEVTAEKRFELRSESSAWHFRLLFA